MTHPTYQSGILFSQAHKAVRARIYAILEKYDLTPTLWSILGASAEMPDGIRLSNIAGKMDVKPPMISVLVEELMHRSILEQIPHHRDGRVKLLILTEKGLALVANIEQLLDDEITHLLQGLNVGEIAVFEKALRNILANAQKQN